MNKSKIFSLFVVIILSTILLNVLFYASIKYNIYQPLTDLYMHGLIIKIKPYAFAFVHGSFIKETLIRHFDYENNTVYYRGSQHITLYNRKLVSTEDFVLSLYLDGYTHIWGTWCHSGDYNYISNYTVEVFNYQDKMVTAYPREYIVPWPSYVSRNTKPGNTIPIFVGIGFVRISVK